MTYDLIFSALADNTRRGIFEALRDEPRSVSELSVDQPVSRPAVSQHLKVLQNAGLVDVVPRGTRRIYSIKRDGLVELRRYLESFWSEALTAYSEEIGRSNTGES